jgi:hypothetical protein
LVEAILTSKDLVTAFGELRRRWTALWDDLSEPPEGPRADSITEAVEKANRAVVSAARLSAEAASFVELAFRIRLDRWLPDDAPPPPELDEPADSLRSGFEMRMRTLRQMESGDDILPDSGRELRKAAARDLAYFRDVRRLAGEEPGAGDGDDEETVHGLLQEFDGRRRLVRESFEFPNAALEAVEFLLRLGAPSV